MPIKVLVVLLSLLLSQFTLAGGDKQSKLSDSYAVHGMGQTECSELLVKEDSESFQLALRIWLNGYFTAINTTGAASGFELSVEDLDRSIAYTNLICKDSGNEKLWLAQVINIFWRQEFHTRTSQIKK